MWIHDEELHGHIGPVAGRNTENDQGKLWPTETRNKSQDRRQSLVGIGIRDGENFVRARRSSQRANPSELSIEYTAGFVV